MAYKFGVALYQDQIYFTWCKYTRRPQHYFPTGEFVLTWTPELPNALAFKCEHLYLCCTVLKTCNYSIVINSASSATKLNPNAFATPKFLVNVKFVFRILSKFPHLPFLVVRFFVVFFLEDLGFFFSAVGKPVKLLGTCSCVVCVYYCVTMGYVAPAGSL